MKKIITIAVLSFFVHSFVVAQTTTKKAVSRTAAKSKRTTELSSSANYTAKSRSSVSLANHYTVLDPVKLFSVQRTVYNLNMDHPASFGMPKSAYGFANGHFSLFSTGATSSGGNTGNGIVGTGSNPGSVGGGAFGLNGKSPYAGFAMWGNARNLWLPKGDSAIRRASGKTH